jgi:hypothetical protein
LWSKGVKPFKIHRRTLAQYGENYILCKGRCTSGWKDFTVAKQVSLMKTAWAIQPCHEWQTALNKNALVQDDRQTTVTGIASKLDISHGFEYYIIHRDIGYHKFVQGGCQSSLEMSTNGYMWKCTCSFCNNSVKERLSCSEFSQAMEHGCTTMSLQANITAWSGSTHHHQRPRNSKV